ncbi:prolipoprotein [Mycoplasma feriruminatoris]|uniref:MSC_0775 family lipoprotein n=1 Tax=Mycoplasma feriruminatoris TaxID=1179777 RepID=UPI00241FC9C6|nr:hypothetical protein [Mycoplasma feriruminatoris]WFQ90760.1 prolipoprotein [Mycoplasma feriruminatoris]
MNNLSFKNFKFKKTFLFYFISILSTTPIITVISCTNTNTINQNSEIFLNLSNKTKLNNNDLLRFETNNQINILSEINEYFINNHVDNLITYKVDGASSKTVLFEDMMLDNYMTKHMEFNQKEFKKILKDKLHYTDNLISRLSFSVDYNNVRRDVNNSFNIVFPIRVRLNLVSHNKAKYQQGLYSEHTIEVYVKDAILKAKNELEVLKAQKDFVEKKLSEVNQKDKQNIEQIKAQLELNITELNAVVEKQEQLKKAFEELKTLKSSDLKVTLNKDKVKKDLLDKWTIHDLDSKQLKEMFSIDESEFKKLKDKYKEFDFKLTLEDVDFKDPSLKQNEGNLKIRVGVNNKKEDVENNFQAGLSIFSKFSFDWNDQFWKKLKLADLVKINTIANTENNTDLSNLNTNNLIVKAYSDQIKDISIDKITSKDFRNANIELNLKLLDSSSLKLVKNIGVGNYSLLFTNQFTKQHIKAPSFATERLDATILPSIDKSFFGSFNSELFSGGYGISRAFYNEKVKTPSYMHIGEDYIANDHQEVLIPYDGEVIAAYEFTTTRPREGVGTVMVLKIPVSSLDWTPKQKEIYLNNNSDHIFMSFLHLDAPRTLNNPKLGWQAKTVELGHINRQGKAIHQDKKRTIQVVPNVTPQTPTKVKKGEVIGYLGSESTNGGWMSHAHVNLYTNRSHYLTKNYFNLKAKNSFLNPSRLKKYKTSEVNYSNLGNIGVHGSFDFIWPNGIQTKEARPNINFKVYETDPKTGKKKQPRRELVNELRDYAPSANLNKWEIEEGYADPNLIYKLRDPRTLQFNIEDYIKVNKQ